MLLKIVIIVLTSLMLQSCTSMRVQQGLQSGKISFESGEYKQAFRELMPVAVEGNAQAEYAVGYMYFYGYGVARDSESGIFWMQKAAAQHYALAEQALQLIQHQKSMT